MTVEHGNEPSLSLKFRNHEQGANPLLGSTWFVIVKTSFPAILCSLVCELTYSRGCDHGLPPPPEGVQHQPRPEHARHHSGHLSVSLYVYISVYIYISISFCRYQLHPGNCGRNFLDVACQQTET